jgi:tetratricopeptide (TPR) repeat protein
LSRDFVKRGEWTRAFESIERAQTRRQLDEYAPESVYLKAVCLAALGRNEEALAHWRLLHDQYGDTRWAERIPEEVQPLLGEMAPLRARAAPVAFEMPKPRYSPGAQRASVAGPVWVEYRLDDTGQPTDLRVIQSAHPLLAGYALEAVASGRWRASAGTAVELPRRALSPFRFQSLWMDEAEDEPLTGSGEPRPSPSEEDEDSDEDEGDDFEIEWFPQS